MPANRVKITIAVMLLTVVLTVTVTTRRGRTATFVSNETVLKDGLTLIDSLLGKHESFSGKYYTRHRRLEISFSGGGEIQIMPDGKATYNIVIHRRSVIAVQKPNERKLGDAVSAIMPTLQAYMQKGYDVAEVRYRNSATHLRSLHVILAQRGAQFSLPAERRIISFTAVLDYEEKAWTVSGRK